MKIKTTNDTEFDDLTRSLELDLIAIFNTMQEEILKIASNNTPKEAVKLIDEFFVES